MKEASSRSKNDNRLPGTIHTLISSGKVDFTVCSAERGANALHLAVIAGNERYSNFCLCARITILTGYKLLNHSSIVECLLKKGAENLMFQVLKEEISVLHLACYMGKLKV